MPASDARVVPLALVFGVNGAVYGSLLSRYPQVADQVGATAGQFGLALAGIGVGGVTGAFAATRVVRFLGGPTRALMLAGVAFLFAGVAVAAAPSLLLLSLAFAALGLFDGFIDTAMNQAGATARERSGSSVMGRLHATLAAATLAGTAVGAILAGTMSVLSHLLVVAVVLLVVLLGALRAMAADDAGRDALGVRVRPGSQGKVTSTPVGRPWRRGRWWAVLTTAGLAAVLVELPAQEWSGLLLSRELSASPTVASTGPLVAVAGILVGRLGLDRAVDLLGWRVVTRLAGAVTAIGTVAGLWIGATTHELAPLLIGLGVAAVGAGTAAPLLFDRAGHLAAHLGLSTEAGPGLVSGVFRLGVLASPLLVGGVAERAGLFLALGVTALAGLALAALAGPLTHDRPH